MAPDVGPAPGAARPPSPSRPAQTRPLPASVPVRLRIERIGVDTRLVGLGLGSDGTMQAPDDYTVAGWYVHAPTPGERGPAIIAGHLDSRRGPAVFYRLHELRPGDEITIARQDHSITVFEVERVERRSKDAFPTSEVYGDIDHAGLRLITCGGAFDRSSGHYHDDVIVYARLRRAIQGVGDAVSTSAAAQVGRAPRAP